MTLFVHYDLFVYLFQSCLFSFHLFLLLFNGLFEPMDMFSNIFNAFTFQILNAAEGFTKCFAVYFDESLYIVLFNFNIILNIF